VGVQQRRSGPVRLSGTEKQHKVVCYETPGNNLIKFQYIIRSSKFVSQRSIARSLAKCRLSHRTFATSKPLKCLTSVLSGSRLPHRSFEWPYAGFLFHSAAQAEHGKQEIGSWADKAIRMAAVLRLQDRAPGSSLRPEDIVTLRFSARRGASYPAIEVKRVRPEISDIESDIKGWDAEVTLPEAA